MNTFVFLTFARIVFHQFSPSGASASSILHKVH